MRSSASETTFGHLQRLSGDRLHQVDQVDDPEQLRQRALEELLRVEVLRRHAGEVADRARACGTGPRIGRSGERKPPALSLPDAAPPPNFSCGSGMRSSVECSRWAASSGIAAQTSPAVARRS